mmetsp:Transcript_28852/g.48034  ORF Transcript_28852/g.48034 Transcript_28852/m.48034 type:complete len:87 (+) Transcript_28852:135-395(+)
MGFGSLEKHYFAMLQRVYQQGERKQKFCNVTCNANITLRGQKVGTGDESRLSTHHASRSPLRRSRTLAGTTDSHSCRSSSGDLDMQ